MSTYQLQYRKCGKPNCSTCRTGKGHGPYGYAYRRVCGRMQTTYIGKVSASHIQQLQEEEATREEALALEGRR